MLAFVIVSAITGLMYLTAGAMLPRKKTPQPKHRLPVLNWVAMKPNQVTGTVFSEIDDEKLYSVRFSAHCYIIACLYVVCWGTRGLPFLSPNQQCQSTEGKISHSMNLLIPSSLEGLPTLSLATNSSCLPLGSIAMPLISPLIPVPHFCYQWPRITSSTGV